MEEMKKNDNRIGWVSSSRSFLSINKENSIRIVRSENKLERKKVLERDRGGTSYALHKKPAKEKKNFFGKEEAKRNSILIAARRDTDPRDRVIAREQSASRGQAEKVVGAAGLCEDEGPWRTHKTRNTMDRPCGPLVGPANTAPSYLGEIYGATD